MRQGLRGFFLSTSLLLAAAVSAQEGKVVWNLDPAHSSVGFVVKHMMVSNVRGQFSSFTGTVTTQGQRPETAAIQVTIDAASIDTRNGDRDKHLRSADFLDVEKFPTITFTSKKVEVVGADKAKIVGDLTLHGVTREVVLEAELSPVVKDPWGNWRAGAHATTTINRKDFGITWSRTLDTGQLVVGDEVTITLDVELVAKP
jgi:polyisoprenoid-binding protein YceI